MTQTPRPTPPPPPITGAVYLPTTAPLPADPTPAARRWYADVAEAESLGHAALVLRYASALPVGSIVLAEGQAWTLRWRGNGWTICPSCELTFYGAEDLLDYTGESVTVVYVPTEEPR